MDTVKHNLSDSWAEQLFQQFSHQLVELALVPGQQLVVCLGGGADSQTLLDLTDRFRQTHPEYTYLAIHLDHSFHEKSAAWAAGLVADCQQRQFPFICEPLQVELGARISKEAAGRNARYQRLVELTQPDAVLLLGQHRNDQIETLFLQLKRGAGPKGLAAMAKFMQRHQRYWWRPLLGISKAEIYQYAHARQLFWIEDDTNYDVSIERNFLRHQVVPLFEQRWPHFGDAVLRSTQLCAENQQLLELLLADRVAPHIDAQGRLASRWMVGQSAELQRGILRFWLQQQQAPLPSFAQLEQLREQMLNTDNNARPKVGWADCLVSRHTADNKDRLLTLTRVSKKR
ncbi:MULTISPECIES: tRNA lysidine(34) synthetase TilS [Idiomarina]|uniref:tRNA lysidine(34) synthetase TilS n=1 Tax=Idiomarina TaxID=135575 RepID=UPI00129C9FEA|nr:MULTISPECIES: tRNA lysidine(34) synthetase TilS [Idiomarina]MRJ42717.1 tRNA lysidine(34) synthetase TilS [Idiomarina sp. FeN1]NCU58281.1 tRNA lysidine(34) synthetase TilS [Idiomarina sp. FenA--70]NCU60979.1 tRNA lysidine(34) synthetase TilS [Idiomarina sp. FenBw--71]UUN14127.1 tRNA lysidine(34) synthetase TilS [Idiomarina loihiensis]